MTIFGFIWKNLFRKKTRAFLTFFSLVVAFFLYLLLGSVGFMFAVDETSTVGASRLVTQAKYSMIDDIPKKYIREIIDTEGVENAAAAVWFGGRYQEGRRFFPTFPVDPISYFDIYREFEIDPDQLQRFADTRVGAVAPKELADEFGWEIGEMIPITSVIYAKHDGSMNWEYELVGTYTAPPEMGSGPFLMHYDYFEEENAYGAGTVGWITMRISDPMQAAAIIEAVDSKYENSPDPTRTLTETEYEKSFLRQIGNIELMMTGILSAVFFTILLLTANTMSQSFRERISELAVLKTFGFADLTLSVFVMAEAVLMCIVPACIGMLVGFALAQTGILQLVSGGMFPIVGIDALNTTLISGFVIAVVLGLAVGLMPSLTTMRLSIVDALTRH